MRDDNQTVKIELLSQWKLEAEFRNFTHSVGLIYKHITAIMIISLVIINPEVPKRLQKAQNYSEHVQEKSFAIPALHPPLFVQYGLSFVREVRNTF